MDTHLLKYEQRIIVLENNSIIADFLKLRLAILHFRRELDKTIMGKFFYKILDWMDKFIK